MAGPITIMVVDDDADMRFLTRAVLEGTELEIVAEASSGEDALELLTAMPAPQRPAVVLLDHRMPGLGGLEVAAQMHDAAPQVLVVLSSSHLDDSLEVKAAEAHVVRCVSKGDALDFPGIIREVVATHRAD